MEARKEVEADPYCGGRLSHYGLDDLPDPGDSEDCPKNMGSIQHTRNLEGRVLFLRGDMRNADHHFLVC